MFGEKLATRLNSFASKPHIFWKDKDIVKAVEELGGIIKTQLNVKKIKVEEEMLSVKKKIKANYQKDKAMLQLKIFYQKDI